MYHEAPLREAYEEELRGTKKTKRSFVAQKKKHGKTIKYRRNRPSNRDGMGRPHAVRGNRNAVRTARKVGNRTHAQTHETQQFRDVAQTHERPLDQTRRTFWRKFDAV
jgi:hypothetical protein